MRNNNEYFAIRKDKRIPISYWHFANVDQNFKFSSSKIVVHFSVPKMRYIPLLKFSGLKGLMYLLFISFFNHSLSYVTFEFIFRINSLIQTCTYINSIPVTRSLSAYLYNSSILIGPMMTPLYNLIISPFSGLVK